VLARHTGKNTDQVTKDCDRNNWMDAEQAIAYGLADKLVEGMPSAGESQALRPT
jgi:ATP-dependent Clp protease protease subunit